MAAVMKDVLVDRRRGVLDDVSPETAKLFVEWATWLKETPSYGPGGGTQSPAHRMMMSKLLGVASFGTAAPPSMPIKLLFVDWGVARLKSKERRAFRAYYLQYRIVEDKAQSCGCDVSTFYRRLARARRTVAAFVEDAIKSRLQTASISTTFRAR